MRSRDEQGSALVELTWLGLLLLVPLLWIVLSVFEVQRGAFAVSGAARAAGRAYALAPSDAVGDARARAAARQVLADHGVGDQPFGMTVNCAPAGDCHAPGVTITVDLRSRVDLPLAAGRPRRRRTQLRPEREPHRPRGTVPGHPVTRDERGQSTVLIVGLAGFLLFAIVVVVDASAAFLQRQGLDTVADGAALSGADAGSRNLETLYGSGVGSQQRLEQAETLARAAVEDYLDRTGARSDYPGLRYDVAFDPTDNSVVVRVRAPLDLPLTIPGSPQRPVVGTVGSAVVQVEDLGR